MVNENGFEADHAIARLAIGKHILGNQQLLYCAKLYLSF
jgi:hypothetical protein